MRFQNRTVIVTGSEGGIGSAIVRRFRSEGANVLCIDIRATDGRECDCIRARADVSKKAEVEAAVRQAVEAFDGVDILVNCAAKYDDMPLPDVTVASFDAVMDTNLTGVMLCIQAVLPYMRERNFGRIINLSSVMAYRGQERHHAYSASKGALFALAKNVAYQAGGDGITVNNVASGPVNTAFPEALSDDMERRDYIIRNNPIRRIAEPEDIVSAVCFLASEEASFITGETILVDGGQSVFLPGTDGIKRVQDIRIVKA